jgi:sporulation protein YlmC with PRC-barrel domain
LNLAAHNLVVSEDGDPIGRIVGVHLNPATNQVVDLIVHAGNQPGQPRITVPVQSVADITDDAIVLSLTAENCRALPSTSIGRHSATSPANAASRQVVRRELDFGAEVLCLDGPVGSLHRLLYDQYSYDVEELVIAAGGYLDHEVGVPVDWARELHRDRIVLSCRREELASMPSPPEDR